MSIQDRGRDWRFGDLSRSVITHRALRERVPGPPRRPTRTKNAAKRLEDGLALAAGTGTTRTARRTAMLFGQRMRQTVPGRLTRPLAMGPRRSGHEVLFVDRAAAQAEAARLDQALRRAEERANTEEDFRIDAVTAIRDVARRYGLELELRAERTIASGRADTVYNRVVIEFEPRSMRSLLTHTATAHAVQQTKDYMTGLSDELGTSLENLSGIAFDGSWYMFVRSVGGE